jgi:hypothetical protein
VTDTPPDDTDLDERERRLRADIQDARKALNRARDRFDQLCEELLDLRYERQQRATARTPTR